MTDIIYLIPKSAAGDVNVSRETFFDFFDLLTVIILNFEGISMQFAVIEVCLLE